MPSTVNQGLIFIFHDERREPKDVYYQICTEGDEFTATINGRTTIQVTNRKVTIDITDGSIESVQFEVQGVSNKRLEGGCAYWKPFAFDYWPFKYALWALDDAKPEDNLLVYVARLALAILLGIFDIFLYIALGAN